MNLHYRSWEPVSRRRIPVDREGVPWVFLLPATVFVRRFDDCVLANLTAVYGKEEIERTLTFPCSRVADYTFRSSIAEWFLDDKKPLLGWCVDELQERISGVLHQDVFHAEALEFMGDASALAVRFLHIGEKFQDEEFHVEHPDG